LGVLVIVDAYTVRWLEYSVFIGGLLHLPLGLVEAGIVLDESVTDWIKGVAAGDEVAAQKLWERYFHRLIPLCRRKLGESPRRYADEEDVALSAFDSFFRGVQNDHFPQLHNRDSFWRLLVVIASRKAADQRHYQRRKKRGGGCVQGESALMVFPDGPGIEQVIGSEPTPEFAALVVEEYRRMLDALNNDTLRNIAVWKMEGFTNQEISARLGCTSRTVERKLRIIRKQWERKESE